MYLLNHKLIGCSIECVYVYASIFEETAVIFGFAHVHKIIEKPYDILIIDTIAIGNQIHLE